MARCTDTCDTGIPHLEKSAHGTATTSLLRQTSCLVFWSITSSLDTALLNTLTAIITNAKLVLLSAQRTTGTRVLAALCSGSYSREPSPHCTCTGWKRSSMPIMWRLSVVLHEQVSNVMVP